jgi:hypothetical protein
LLDAALEKVGIKKLLSDYTTLIDKLEQRAPEELRDVLRTMIRVRIDPKKRAGYVDFMPTGEKGCTIDKWRWRSPNEKTFGIWKFRLAA